MKKRVNGTWVTASPLKYGTSTDTLTTLPADLYADGQSATVGLVGNMVQSGVPSPSSIIMPSECGDKTANLFDKDNTNIVNAYFENNDNWKSNAESSSVVIPVEPNTEYTLSVQNSLSIFRINETSSANPVPDSSISFTRIVRGTNIAFYTFTTLSTTKNIVFQGTYADTQMWFNSLMLNLGSSALPYEPYGYKIPISSGGTTTPVYLGEVETTRRIYEAVLTGQEPWGISGTTIYQINNDVLSYSSLICTHFPNTSSGMWNGNNWKMQVDISSLGLSTKSQWTDYLAAQYANGTPVTVWYVLATETTGIVNEPIRKIGDYADTVSGITIPTIAGKDSFDVQTTLKPSEVSLAYTGWHDASVKEWDGSEWQ